MIIHFWAERKPAPYKYFFLSPVRPLLSAYRERFEILLCHDVIFKIEPSKSHFTPPTPSQAGLKGMGKDFSTQFHGHLGSNQKNENVRKNKASNCKNGNV